MKSNAQEKFNEGLEKVSRSIAYQPLNGYHSFEFYVWAIKASKLQLVLAILFIVLPAYLSNTLMQSSVVQGIALDFYNAFPVFQFRFETIKQLREYSANRYAIASVLCFLMMAPFTAHFLYGYFKFWNTYEKDQDVDHRGLIGALFGCLLFAGMIWVFFIFTPSDLDPSYLGSFGLITGPLFPVYCAIIAITSPYAISQPIVFIIKLVHQLTFGFYKERH